VKVGSKGCRDVCPPDEPLVAAKTSTWARSRLSKSSGSAEPCDQRKDMPKKAGANARLSDIQFSRTTESPVESRSQHFGNETNTAFL